MLMPRFVNDVRTAQAVTLPGQDAIDVNPIHAEEPTASATAVKEGIKALPKSQSQSGDGPHA